MVKARQRDVFLRSRVRAVFHCTGPVFPLNFPPVTFRSFEIFDKTKNNICILFLQRVHLTCKKKKKATGDIRHPYLPRAIDAVNRHNRTE